MKKVDFGQAINTLANIGVIVGILFLAFEVRQYDQQLKSQSRYNYYDSRINGFNLVALNPEFLEIGFKFRNGEEVSELEYSRMSSFILGLFTGWEYEFLEYREGRLSIEELNIKAKQAVMDLGVLPYLQFWEFYRPLAPQSFVEFMEENIVNRQ